MYGIHRIMEYPLALLAGHSALFPRSKRCPLALEERALKPSTMAALFGPGTVNGIPPPPPLGQQPGRATSAPIRPPSTPSHPSQFFNRPLQEQAFLAFSITGIPVRVHWLLLCVWIIQACIGALRYGSFGFVLYLLLFGPLLWTAVLLHECCHCWAARSVGAAVDSILLWPLGGLAFIGQTPSPKEDIKVAVAGPASHLPHIALFLLLFAVSPGGVVTGSEPDAEDERWGDFWRTLWWEAWWLHMSLMLFNLLLPCYPLDGSRILVGSLLVRGCSVHAAARCVIKTSVGVIVVICCYLFVTILTGGIGSVVTIFVLVWLSSQVLGR